MLTREEALNKLHEIKRNTQHNGYMWASDVENMFYKIYNDHEARLKAKDDEIKDLHIAMIKLNEHYHIAKNDLKVELKAKYEEIERLNCRAYHAEGYINDLHNHPKDKKFYDAKARKIVAMLFWEWKKAIPRTKINAYDYFENGCNTGRADIAEDLFKQAYKMLKENA